MFNFDNSDSSVQLDCSVTKDKEPTHEPAQKFKFLPHRTFRRWRFGYPTLHTFAFALPHKANPSQKQKSAILPTRNIVLFQI